MSRFSKYCKSLLLIGLSSLALVGCGFGDDTLTTGYYKDVAIKANGEFVIKDKVDDDKAKKGGIYYYVEVGKDGATKDKVTSITSKAGDIPIDIEWKGADINEPVASMSKVTVDYGQEGYIKQTYEVASGNKAVGRYGSSSVRYKIAQEGENKGKIERAYYYNSKGDNEVFNNLAQTTFTYTKNGNINEITFLDKNGEKKAKFDNANILGFLYDNANSDKFIGYELRDHNGTPIGAGRQYSRVVYEYDKNGRITSTKFLSKSGELIGDSSKSLVLFVTEIGQLKNQLSLMRQSMFTNSTETRYTYDEKHSGPVKISFYGIDGQLEGSDTILKGVAELVIGYDDNDNINNLKFIGKDGQSIAPAFYATENPDEIKLEYDDKANISQIKYYKNGEIIPLPSYTKGDESNVAFLKYKYDEQRRLSEVTLFDKTGNPTYNTIYGTVKYYGYKINYTGKESERIYLDADGKEFKPNPADILIGTWRQVDSSTGFTWVIHTDGTIDIIRPKGNNSNYYYTVSNVNINSGGTGTMQIQFTNKETNRALTPESLKFTSVNRFEFNDGGYPFVRQSN